MKSFISTILIELVVDAEHIGEAKDAIEGRYTLAGSKGVLPVSVNIQSLREWMEFQVVPSDMLRALRRIGAKNPRFSTMPILNHAYIGLRSGENELTIAFIDKYYGTETSPSVIFERVPLVKASGEFEICIPLTTQTEVEKRTVSGLRTMRRTFHPFYDLLRFYVDDGDQPISFIPDLKTMSINIYYGESVSTLKGLDPAEFPQFRTRGKDVPAMHRSL